LVAAGPKL